MIINVCKLLSKTEITSQCSKHAVPYCPIRSDKLHRTEIDKICMSFILIHETPFVNSDVEIHSNLSHSQHSYLTIKSAIQLANILPG